ncbi:MAG: SOS response-associated peptidase [Rhodospirillales bacterium]|nr:MAG: SOS response-associated peptidase [Rhodospirillales bacterium]
MCGRYDLYETPRDVAAWFRAADSVPDFPPRYNIAPSQDAPVLRLDPDGDRELAMLRWGLVPFWAEDVKIGYRTINARAETVHRKPAFRSAFRRRRCLVPATGYYEWQTTHAGKQPWRFVSAEGPLFAFAGLWERWEKTDEAVESFTIIVTDANDRARPIHDRMPVILEPADHDIWLGSDDVDTLRSLLRPLPADRMTCYPVSTRVGDPRNDDAGLIEPVNAKGQS